MTGTLWLVLHYYSYNVELGWRSEVGGVTLTCAGVALGGQPLSVGITLGPVGLVAQQ